MTATHPIEGHALTLDKDDEGGDIAQCKCGWTSPVCPDQEIASEFFSDHLVAADRAGREDIAMAAYHRGLEAGRRLQRGEATIEQLVDEENRRG